MPLRRSFNQNVLLVVLVAMMPLHAYADAEYFDVKSCILRFAQFAKSKVSAAKSTVEDDELRRAAEKYLRRQQPVDATRGTLATKLYYLSSEPMRTPLQSVVDVRGIPGIRPQAGAGLGFKEVLQGEIRGRHVFIKISPVQIVERPERARRTLQELTNEVAWIKRLDRLGVGPKFYGLTEKDGYRGLITDFVDGEQLGLWYGAEMPSQNFRPTAALIKSLEKMAKTIEQEGIAAKDLQIRITRDRAYIVDPEYFYPAEKVGEIENSTENIKKLITELKTRMSHQSKKVAD